jgi:hypothetical protein
MKQLYSNLRWVLAAVALITSAEIAAKNNIHVFKAAIGTYTPLANATSVTNAVMAYDSFVVSSLAGETFNLMGKPRTLASYGIMIMKDGRIQFSEDTAFAVIDALYSILESVDATTSVSYVWEGTGVNKVFKVEWKNLRVKSGQAGNFINVQTWIYPATGIIEFHYGPRSATNASGYTNPSTALYIGVSYCDNSITKMYEKMQVVGSIPNYTVDSNLNLNVPHIQGAPEEGTIFRFVPKAVTTNVTTAKFTDDIAVYPNPTSNTISLALPFIATTTVTIRATDGRVVHRSAHSDARFDVDVSNITGGVYHLTISDGVDHFTKPIVISH